MANLINLDTRGKIQAVYKDPNKATRRKTPKGIKLPKNNNIILAIMLLKTAIKNMSIARTESLSIDTFLDNLISRRDQIGNNRMFKPKVFALKISFRLPAKILEDKALRKPR